MKKRGLFVGELVERLGFEFLERRRLFQRSFGIVAITVFLYVELLDLAYR